MSAPIKAPTGRIGVTHDLRQVAEIGDVGRLSQLLARGADVNATDDVGVTALMVAAYYGRLEMVRVLTNHGADVNLADIDGFTAAMLADRAGHEEIVRLLVARGAKEIPKRPAPELSPLRSVEDEMFAAPAEVAPTAGNSAVRTLHGPPNIWDMVHETEAEFNPRSALIGHLPPIGTLALAVIAFITVGAAIFAFVNLKRFSGSPPDARSAHSQDAKATTSPASPPLVPAGTDSSSAQQASAQVSEPGPIQSSPIQQPATSSAAASLATNALKSQIDVVTPRKKADKVVLEKPGRQDQTSSTSSASAPLFSNDTPANKEKAQESTPPAPKIDLVVPQADSEKPTEPTGAKKEDPKKDSEKSASPPAAVSPKATPTPQPR